MRVTYVILLSIYSQIFSCRPNVVRMDLKEIIAVCKEELFDMYMENDFLALIRAVSNNPFIKRLGLVPSSVYTLQERDEVNFRCYLNLLFQRRTASGLYLLYMV